MIEQIHGLPENVLAFSAKGDVTAEDYESVLIPAMDAAHDAHGKVRLLFQMGPEFSGYEKAAMWDDAKVGMKHFTHFEKVAIVSEDKSIVRSVKAFGFMMPGEVELFSNDQMDAAKAWIAA